MGGEDFDKGGFGLERADFEVVFADAWRSARYLKNEPAEVQRPIGIESKRDRFGNAGERHPEVNQPDLDRVSGFNFPPLKFQFLFDDGFEQGLLARKVAVYGFL